MRALVLFYAYDGLTDHVDPIAIVSEAVWENLDEADIEEIFDSARHDYNASREHCREAWVRLPDASFLFDTPDIGRATIDSP
jgi:hypothetical protein